MSTEYGLGPPSEQDWAEFMEEDDDSYEWVIPGLLERRDRAILTGPEGKGKSTLLRQIGWRLACGQQPFVGAPIMPRRVLYLDFENSRKQVRRKLRPFTETAKPEEPGAFKLEVRPDNSINLLELASQNYLTGMFARVRPDLVVAGPVYKMGDGDRHDEVKALALSRYWDKQRDVFKFALILEDHTPHSYGGDKDRPYGASLWKRWPEFGLHLKGNGELTHWRGPRDERDWPSALMHDSPWPWGMKVSAPERDWVIIRAAYAEAAERPSINRIVRDLGIYRSGVQRALEVHADDWKDMWR